MSTECGGLCQFNPIQKKMEMAYAIDKLKLATAIKEYEGPWCIYVNLGDAYKKTEWLERFGNVLWRGFAFASRLCRASYRIGKIYQTQGPPGRSHEVFQWSREIPAAALFIKFIRFILRSTNVPQRPLGATSRYCLNSDDDPNVCRRLLWNMHRVYLPRRSLKAEGLYKEQWCKPCEIIWNRRICLQSAGCFWNEGLERWCFFTNAAEGQILVHGWLLFQLTLLFFLNFRKRFGHGACDRTRPRWRWTSSDQ